MSFFKLIYGQGDQYLMKINNLNKNVHIYLQKQRDAKQRGDFSSAIWSQI